MAASHAAIQGSNESLRKVTRALLSVSDKTDIVSFAQSLTEHGVVLLSTGGTAKKLREAGLAVVDVSEHTGSPEMLDGRVKTLHPKIHGGILAVRGNESHENDLITHGIPPIDVVVLNLYPFENTVAKGSDFDTCVENVDIGGPAMLRAAAKNHKAVAVVTNPSQYASVVECLTKNNGHTTLELRKQLACDAFTLSAQYDTSISNYFKQQTGGEGVVVNKSYKTERKLKYGCNPNQKEASLCSIDGRPMPFTVLNGNPGYINLLDACNAWQLVRELRQATSLPAAASFKHVSPAGAAVAVELTEAEQKAYETTVTTPSALAYLRARQADPMSSFGDFAALSDHVDVETAKVLKKEVSDGIIAPSYDPEALEILKSKKGGKFIVLQGDPNYAAPELEYREVFGTCFVQSRNHLVLSSSSLSKIVTTKEKELSKEAERDLLVGSIALKYTQSNSVGYAINGQMIGVGAGQQSRVDCVKLAGRKVRVWYLRQHPKVLGLKFKEGVKRQARINARVRYIEGDFSEIEKAQWLTQFTEAPEELTLAEKDEFMKGLSGVSLSSDAFFPFRDSIDAASLLGVSYVAQAGGSVKDDEVIQACDEYGMAMSFTGVRLFHH